LAGRQVGLVAATAFALACTAPPAWAGIPTERVDRTVTVPPAGFAGPSVVEEFVPCPVGHLAAGSSQLLGSPDLGLRASTWFPEGSRVLLANPSDEPQTAELGVVCVPRSLRIRGHRYRLREPSHQTDTLTLDPSPTSPPFDDPRDGIRRLACESGSFPVVGGFELGAGVRLYAAQPEIRFGPGLLFGLLNEGSATATSNLQTVCFHPRLKPVGARSSSVRPPKLNFVLATAVASLENGALTTLRSDCLTGSRALGGGFTSPAFGTINGTSAIVDRAVEPGAYSVKILSRSNANASVSAGCARIERPRACDDRTGCSSPARSSSRAIDWPR
jgi:hypothetical protein